MARSLHVLRARGNTLALGRRTALMGVINVTPDSFFPASRFLDPHRAVAAGLQMVRAGADILDVGGESTRPGAKPVPVEEELRRVMPVLTGLREETDALLSIDTRKAAVAERALEAGVDMINDISALAGDPAMAAVAARTGAGLVLMHMQGAPETMQERPTYRDVVDEVRTFLGRAAERAEGAGVAPESILLDPGIGFGKTVEHNLQLLNRLPLLTSTLGKPVLVGTSRKTFIGRLLNLPADERLHGTAAAVAACILRGAHVVRVHDVPEMQRVAQVTDAILNESAGRSIASGAA